MATIQDKIKLLQRKQKELRNLTDRVLPIKIGNKAASLFKENFRKAGYQDGSLTPWAITRRQQMGGSSAASSYTPLLSGRNHLMNSINYYPSRGSVSIRTGAGIPYARIHNQGGRITTRVTPRMRKFAWAKFYESGGGKRRGVLNTPADLTDEQKMWKGLALTRKTQITRRIPKRQYMGHSQELKTSINQIVTDEVNKVLKE